MAESQEDFSIYVNDDCPLLMDEEAPNTLSSENIESTSQEKPKTTVKKRPAISKKRQIKPLHKKTENTKKSEEDEDESKKDKPKTVRKRISKSPVASKAKKKILEPKKDTPIKKTTKTSPKEKSSTTKEGETKKKPAPKKVTKPTTKDGEKKKKLAPKKTATKKKENDDGLDDLESVLITEPRKTKKKTITKKKVARPMLCTSSLSVEERSLAIDVVQPRNLGKFDLAVTVTENVTHLILGEKKRTLKVLYAIAAGIWILKPDWLMDSVVFEKYQPEEKYEASDWFPGCKIARLERKAGRGLFDNKKIYLHRNTEVPRDDLEAIITAAGGILCKPKDCSVCVSDQVVTADIPDGTSCVSSDWILDSLEKGKILGYDEYIIEEVDGEEEKDDNVSEDANTEEKEKEDNMDENKEEEEEEKVEEEEEKEKEEEDASMEEKEDESEAKESEEMDEEEDDAGSESC